MLSKITYLTYNVFYALQLCVNHLTFHCVNGLRGRCVNHLLQRIKLTALPGDHKLQFRHFAAGVVGVLADLYQFDR